MHLHLLIVLGFYYKRYQNDIKLLRYELTWFTLLFFFMYLRIIFTSIRRAHMSTQRRLFTVPPCFCLEYDGVIKSHLITIRLGVITSMVILN